MHQRCADGGRRRVGSSVRPLAGCALGSVTAMLVLIGGCGVFTGSAADDEKPGDDARNSDASAESGVDPIATGDASDGSAPSGCDVGDAGFCETFDNLARLFPEGWGTSSWSPFPARHDEEVFVSPPASCHLHMTGSAPKDFEATRRLLDTASDIHVSLLARVSSELPVFKLRFANGEFVEVRADNALRFGGSSSASDVTFGGNAPIPEGFHRYALDLDLRAGTVAAARDDDPPFHSGEIPKNRALVSGCELVLYGSPSGEYDVWWDDIRVTW